MAIGLEAGGTDTDTLFALATTGAYGTMNIKASNIDIGTRYQGLTHGGTQRSNVGIEFGGVDIATKLAEYGTAPTPTPTPTCVEESMCFSPSLTAGQAYVGRYFDGVGFSPKYRLIPQVIEGVWHSLQPCFHVISENGAELITSYTTPMPLRERPAVTIAELTLDDEVFVCFNGRFRWEKIRSLEAVGPRNVVLIKTGIQCFLSGVDPNNRIASHIPHSLYAMENPGPEFVAVPMIK
jgi:hypothetical protein